MKTTSVLLAEQKIPLVLLLAVAATGCEVASGSVTAREAPTFRLEYPVARVAPDTEVMHGEEIADPYRWLEATDSEESQAWLRAQDELLDAFLADVERRDDIEARILDYLTYDRLAAPISRGDATFRTVLEAGATSPQVWVERAGEERLLVDLDRALGENRRSGGFTLSLDGELAVVQVSEEQSRWHELRVLDTRTGEWLPDALTGYLAGRGGITWDATGDGFFYTRFEMPAEAGGVRTAVSDTRLFYHRVGTQQSDDVLVYERPDQPSWLFFPSTSLDGRYLILAVADPESQGNRLYYAELRPGAARPWGEVVRLIDDDDATVAFEATDGEALILLTSHGAPNQRVVRVDPDRPQPGAWTELIPEGDFPIGGLSVFDGAYVLSYVVHARSTLRVHDPDGTLRHEIDLTGRGFLSAIPDAPDGTIAHFALFALYDPGSIYALDVQTGEVELHRRPELTYDPARYTFDQVFYESFDGTRVPMFLVRRTDVEPGPDTPTLMYGYGAFGWSAYPWYQPEFIPWLDLGGVYALPGIRGGGEYGNDWWEAGRILNKENVIGDYIAAAEFLVESGRTSPRWLVGNGGSASGVLPAVAAMRRPELFAATVIQYPTLDMLRYHLFGGWPSEFGTADDPEEFEVLRRISPYHIIDPGECYPPMIVQAGALDEVTSPVHAYKFAAAMQGPAGAGTQNCGHPQLLKIAWQAGHSPGGTPKEQAGTGADQIAFLIKVLGLDSR